MSVADLRRGQPTVSTHSTLALALAAFLLTSLANTLQRPDGIAGITQFGRWGVLALLALMVLLSPARTGLSNATGLWTLSAIYALGTALYTIDPPATVLRGASFVALCVGVFAGGERLGVAAPRAAERLVRVAAYAVGAVMLLSVASWALRIGFAFHEGSGLFRGVFAHANSLGAVSAVWTVLLLPTREQSRGWGRALTNTMLGAAILATLLSSSRSGVLSAGLACGVYLALTRRMGRIAAVSFAAVSLGVGVLAVSPGVIQEVSSQSRTFLLKGAKDEDLLHSRRGVVEVGWENFLLSPYVGHGFGTSFGEVENSEWKIANLSGREKGNAVIAVLEETGVIGAFALFAPVVFILSRFNALRVLVSRHRDDGGAAAGNLARTALVCWCAALGGFLNNMAEATLWSPGAQFGGMLLLFAGLAEGLRRHAEVSDARTDAFRPKQVDRLRPVSAR